MVITVEKIGAALGAIAGLAGLVVASLSYSKQNQINSKINMAVSDISSKTPVDIKDAIIERAVEVAVDREVGRSVTLAANTAVKKIAADMETQIRKPVSESFSNIEKSVANEISRQVAQLDIEVLKKDVVEKAKAAVLKKFDGSLDEVLKGFNDNLDNVAKVYGAVAGSMAKRQERGVFLKFD